MKEDMQMTLIVAGHQLTKESIYAWMGTQVQKEGSDLQLSLTVRAAKGDEQEKLEGGN